MPSGNEHYSPPAGESKCDKHFGGERAAPPPLSGSSFAARALSDSPTRGEYFLYYSHLCLKPTLASLLSSCGEQRERTGSFWSSLKKILRSACWIVLPFRQALSCNRSQNDMAPAL